MASRNVEIVISGRDRFTSTANKVIGSLHRIESSAGRVGRGVGQMGAGLARVGVIAGTVVATGLGAAAKNAIDFQDAFAGVRKTIEASPAELEKLNQQLRDLSTRIPVKFTDLAAIAQEAGALGVPTKNVANFTEVVARLSAATVGLTVDAAAEAFGKLGNVLKLTGPDYEKLGSALIALGNAGASSEGDIIEVAKRFGAAGATAQLSAAQVLGFSSAIASMGVEPEAAGSSLSRLFNNITKYIGTANPKIEAFAAVTGMSVKKFSAFFAKDASGAVQTFLKKLSTMDRFKASAALKSAGIINVRDINAVLLLSRGWGELKRQVDLATVAYQENTQLAEVSAKRFDTLKSKLTELKNAGVLASVILAEGFLPALGRAVEKLSAFLALDTTKSGLKAIGEDIGRAIDSINWADVLAGARQFVDLMKGALGVAKLMFDAFNTLPGPIKEATAGFLVLNKLSGGLIGAGAANIGGGLIGGVLRAGASRIPGIGAAFAQPVFVTNWPLGGLGGGGIATAAGGLGLVSKVFLVGEAIGLGLLVNGVREDQGAQRTAQALELQATLDKMLAQNPDQTALANALAGIDRGIHDIEANPLNVLIQGDALDILKSMRNEVAVRMRGTEGPTVLGPPAPLAAPLTTRIGSQRGLSSAGLAIPGVAAAVTGNELEAIMKRGIAAGFHPSEVAVQRTFDKNEQHLKDIATRVALASGDTRSEMAGIRNAIEHVKPPIVNVDVTVGAAAVVHHVTFGRRFGPDGGSRHNSGTAFTPGMAT